MKGQGSIEYTLMIAAAIVIVTVAIVLYLGTVGKSSQAQIKAELLAAASPSANTIGFATNLPINTNIASTSGNSIFYINGNPYVANFLVTNYTTQQGYEYEIGNNAGFNSITSISSIVYNLTNGKQVVITAISGKLNVIQNSTFPFSFS
ncbi:MAG: class III signal peptide-containing protein [Saccharolobus sp.]